MNKLRWNAYHILPSDVNPIFPATLWWWGRGKGALPDVPFSVESRSSTSANCSTQGTTVVVPFAFDFLFLFVFDVTPELSLSCTGANDALLPGVCEISWRSTIPQKPSHRNQEIPRAMTAVVSTYSYSLDYGLGALKIQNACRPARNVQATNFQNLDEPEVRRSSKLRPARESKCIAAAIDSIDHTSSTAQGGGGSFRIGNL